MRTYTTEHTAYTVDELKQLFPDSYQKALESWSENAANEYWYFFNEDVLNPINDILKTMGTRICDYDLIPFCSANMSANCISISDEFEMTNLRRYKWIVNNIPFYKGKFYYKNGKSRTSKVISVLSGDTYYVITFLELLKENAVRMARLQGYRDIDIDDCLENTFNQLAKQLVSDCEKYLSDENNFLEESREREQEYNKDGKLI